MLIEYGNTEMVAYRNQPRLCFGIVKFLMSIFLILFGASISAQTIEIKLVDGRNGRPMVRKYSHVNVWVGKKRQNAIVIPTDVNGIARLQLTLNTEEITVPNGAKDSGSNVFDNPVVEFNESLQINVPYAFCASGESNYSWLGILHFSTKEILDRGFVSPNICGRDTVTPKPGQVILFVRPLTFWEELKE
jgi:hypothetical protein